MRCHECGAEAAYAPRTGHLRVGLCEGHLRERLAEFPEHAALAALREAAVD